MLSGELGQAPPDDSYVRADGFVRVRPPAEPPRRPVRRYALPAAVVLACAGLWFALGRPGLARSGDDGDQSSGPETTSILDPLGANGELPTVSDAGRLRAEANLHQAMIPVLLVFTETGTYEAATPEQLAGYDTSFTYLTGSQPSGAADQVSVAVPEPGTAVAAVVAGDDRCAYARADEWANVAYLTVETSSPCAAATAPTTGWGATAGGPVQPGMPDLSGIPGFESITGTEQLPAEMDI